MAPKPPVPEKKKPGAVLIAALGGAPKRSHMGDEPMMDEELPNPEGDDLMGEPVREDFEDYALQAFPDLVEDPMRLRALKQAIESVIRAPKRSMMRGV